MIAYFGRKLLLVAVILFVGLWDSVGDFNEQLDSRRGGRRRGHAARFSSTLTTKLVLELTERL